MLVRTILEPVRLIGRSNNPAVRLAKRAAVFLLHRMDVVVAARLQSGDVLYVDLANAVGRTIWLRNDYSAEDPITRLVRSLLSRGDVFFDVGANVGFFSLIASRVVGEGGHVHAFEPLPKLAQLLRRSVAANKLRNVSVVEVAVGRAAGTASIASMRDSAYSHVMNGANAVSAGHGSWKPVSVRTLALDDYVERMNSPLPRLVKIDIEGSEIDAINGASRLLSGSEAPDVICEVGTSHLARFNHTPIEVFDRFREMGYEPLNPRTGAVMQIGDLSDHEYNVFFRKRA